MPSCIHFGIYLLTSIYLDNINRNIILVSLTVLHLYISTITTPFFTGGKDACEYRLFPSRSNMLRTEEKHRCQTSLDVLAHRY